MKKLLFNLVLIGAVACATQTVGLAQSTNASQFKATVTSFVDHVTTATNWNVHTEALYVDAFKQHVGARIGFDYLISQNIYSTLSLAEAGGSLYGLTGNFGLKQRWDLFSKGVIGITTAGKMGAGTCLSGMTFGSFTVPGKSVSSGEFFGVIGSDIVIDFPRLKYMPNILLGYEKWSNLSGGIYSGGLHWQLDPLLNLL